MSILAITTFKSRISPRFDHADSILLVTIRDNEIADREKIRLVETNPIEKIKALSKMKVDVLICDGITNMCTQQLSVSKIKVIPWIRGETETVLKSYLSGSLKSSTNCD